MSQFVNRPTLDRAHHPEDPAVMREIRDTLKNVTFYWEEGKHIQVSSSLGQTSHCDIRLFAKPSQGAKSADSKVSYFNLEISVADKHSSELGYALEELNIQVVPVSPDNILPIDPDPSENKMVLTFTRLVQGQGYTFQVSDEGGMRADVAPTGPGDLRDATIDRGGHIGLKRPPKALAAEAVV